MAPSMARRGWRLLALPLLAAVLSLTALFASGIPRPVAAYAAPPAKVMLTIERDATVVNGTDALSVFLTIKCTTPSGFTVNLANGNVSVSQSGVGPLSTTYGVGVSCN